MIGGLINVVSYVSSDLYLTGAPQITFYKMVYRRYTNFAVESVEQAFAKSVLEGFKIFDSSKGSYLIDISDFLKVIFDF